VHYYKRNIGDYHKRAGRLSMLEHGAYTLLSDAIYDREQFPTRAEAIDWCWARTTEEVAAVDFVLSRFFTLNGDRFEQADIQKEIDAYKARAVTNQAVAAAREEARRTNRARNVDESPRGDHGSSPNQEPRTINQETGTGNPGGGGAQARHTRRQPPPDFAITTELRAWAEEEMPDVDIQVETAKFRDYTFKTARTEKQWQGEWRNWMRKAHERLAQQWETDAMRAAGGGYVSRM
jgi:uncharacterized protein YdaU (DUF1376 family)